VSIKKSVCFFLGNRGGVRMNGTYEYGQSLQYRQRRRGVTTLQLLHRLEMDKIDSRVCKQFSHDACEAAVDEGEETAVLGCDGECPVFVCIDG
jgi:hypothetical protein